MTQSTDVLIAVTVVAAAFAVLTASLVKHATHRRRQVTPPAPPARPTGLWLVCKTTACAHMTRLHDPSPTGPVCRTCGDTKGGTQ